MIDRKSSDDNEVKYGTVMRTRLKVQFDIMTVLAITIARIGMSSHLVCLGAVDQTRASVR